MTSTKPEMRKRGDRQHDRSRKDHEGHRQAEGDPTRARDAKSIASSQGIADPHRRRLGDAERDHESQRDDLEDHGEAWLREALISPMSSTMAEKVDTSKMIVAPIGAPSRHKAAKAGPSIRQSLNRR